MALAMKAIYLGVALLAIFAFITLIAMLGSFQQAFSMQGLFNSANPVALFAIAGALVFGGIYFFKAGGQMIKEIMK